MKLWLPLLALALLQLAPSDAGPAADPQHLRFQRAVRLSTQAGGLACAPLDAAVYAHASNRAASDLRLYNGGDEVPFALTENSAAPIEPEHLLPQNVRVQDGRIVLDLAMPARPYSEVDLGLNLHDFIAIADVTAPQPNAAPVRLGTFTLFDLSSQHGARSTALALQESTFPRLHIALRLSTPDGKPIAPASVQALVTGATVPPSREAQTLYTVIAETRTIETRGRDTVADLKIAPHVPVERASVVLDPGFHANFSRPVSVTFTPQNQRLDDGQTQPQPETMTGTLSRENFSPSVVGAPPVHDERLSIDATTAANSYVPAQAQIVIRNGDDPPLPIRAVRLEMRQRRICFNARPGAAYTLRYGDAALRAPGYDFAGRFNAAAPAAEASLGPEQPNPAFTARADTRPYTDRHPELLWTVLLGIVVLLGATALGSVKHQRRRQRR